MRPLLLALALFVTGGATAAAQTPPSDSAGPTPVLTLEEAVSLARRNNPAHRQILNNRNVAGAQLRSAYAAFLPSADVSFGTQYREGGGQFFNGVTLGASSPVMASSYDLGLTARYNAATLINPKLQHANLRAAEADAAGSNEQLQAAVRQQYLTVLQQEATAALQDTLVATSQAQLELARARAAVGSATSLDVARAEVALGQQQVTALQARNQIEIEKVRLFQQMGIQQPANVRLTSEFAVSEFTTPLPELLALAGRRNPTLNAARARESVAGLSYRAAQGQYTPTLVVQSFWGGYAQQFTNDDFVVGQALGEIQGPCRQRAFVQSVIDNAPQPDFTPCNALTLPAADRQAALDANNQFPFNFTKNPWQIQAAISFPIFNGLVREQQVQQAAADRADARYAIRAQELAVTASVTTAYLTLQTAARTATLQEQNARMARQALTLAEERFRVGANTFLDVAQAQAEFGRAETARINAIYDYHRAFAALESAVGAPLR